MSIIRGDVATAKATLLPLRVKLLKNAAGTSDKVNIDGLSVWVEIKCVCVWSHRP